METTTEKKTNPIARLLNGLPANVSENKKTILRNYNRASFYRHFMNPEYDIRQLSVQDMIKLKEVLGITEEFFTGDEQTVEELLIQALKKHQPLIAA